MSELNKSATTKALTAIVARIRGEFDNPDLMELGPLLPDTTADILRLAVPALGASYMVDQIASTEGTVSVHEGVATLPSGEQLKLVKALEFIADTGGFSSTGDDCAEQASIALGRKEMNQRTPSHLKVLSIKYESLCNVSDERALRIRALTETLTEIKKTCLTTTNAQAGFAHIVRLCIDAGITKQLGEL